MHNYCRNPNPGKESRPWCFTGPGKYEYCDIPACGNIGICLQFINQTFLSLRKYINIDKIYVIIKRDI